jgi:peptide/nickel transport system permease protein
VHGFILRRLLGTIPVLVGLSIVLFVFVHLLPGNPARSILGEHATPEAVAQLTEDLGLNRPLWEQYLLYIKQLAHGDLGTSVINNQPVLSEFMTRFPATVELALASLLFATLLGIPLGKLAARRPHSWVDGGVTVVSLLGVSVPIFVLGLTLQYIFGVKLGILPTSGQLDARLSVPRSTNFVLIDTLLAGDWSAFLDALRHLVLPAVALGFIPMAMIARITRASVLDVTHEDYVRTARAKGLSKRRVNNRHIMRNAWLPVTTVIGLQVGSLLAGAVVTETVFSWNGVGSWVVGAIGNRDYFVIQSSILIFGLIFVLVNLTVDIAYAFLNPRIRYA